MPNRPNHCIYFFTGYVAVLEQGNTVFPNNNLIYVYMSRRVWTHTVCLRICIGTINVLPFLFKLVNYKSLVLGTQRSFWNTVPVFFSVLYALPNISIKCNMYVQSQSQLFVNFFTCARRTKDSKLRFSLSHAQTRHDKTGQDSTSSKVHRYINNNR